MDDQKETGETQESRRPVEVADNAGLRKYLHENTLTLSSKGIGLLNYQTDRAAEVFWAIAEGREIGAKPEDYGILAASFLFNKNMAEVAERRGFQVTYEGYDLQNASSNAFSVVEQFGGIALSDEEKRQFKDILMIVPRRAMNMSDQDIFGIVLKDPFPESVWGVLIADRKILSKEDYSLEGKSIVVRPADNEWQRKITHELVHFIKCVRSGVRQFDMRYSPRINEGMAAILEYISGLPPEQRESEVGRILKEDLTMGEYVDGHYFGTRSTYRDGPSARNLVEAAQILGVGLPELVTTYMQSSSEREMANSLLAGRDLPADKVSRVKALL